MDNKILDLFGLVIVDSEEEITNNINYIDIKNGLCVYDNVDRSKIDQWIEATKISGTQLNAGFHKSWSVVENKSERELVEQQLLHYITSYLATMMDLDKTMVMVPYIPNEKLEVPTTSAIAGTQFRFKVIRGITKNKLVDKILEYIKPCIPLDSDTVADLVSILKLCGYEFTGEEVIGNSEARIYMYSALNLLPKGTEDLFRFIFFKASGSTLVINSKNIKGVIARLKTDISKLGITKKHIEILSRSFNRRKDIWLSIKKANINNVAIVNRISKLSKIYHEPYIESNLKKVTSKLVPIGLLKSNIESSSTSNLVSLLNVIYEYSVVAPRAYRIRNGKTWINPIMPALSTLNEKDYQQELSKTIREELIKRIKIKGKVYIPENIQYSIPKSEKDFIGNIPNGTTINVNVEESHTLLVGIHWTNTSEDEPTDLDLKGFTLSGIVGWDFKYRNSELLFSGDNISAPLPDGASEWLYTKITERPIATLVTVNKFSCADVDCNFKFIIAYEDNIATAKYINKNYLVDPNNILYSTDLCFKYGEPMGKCLGIIIYNPETKNLSFTFSNSYINDDRSNINHNLMSLYRQALYNKSINSVHLNELLSLKEDVELITNPSLIDSNTLDLSPQSISKTTFLSHVI